MHSTPYTPVTDRHTNIPKYPLHVHVQTLAGAFGGAQQLPLQTPAADLRGDHASESGALVIYRGILAITRDAGVRRFAQASRHRGVPLERDRTAVRAGLSLALKACRRI